MSAIVIEGAIPAERVALIRSTIAGGPFVPGSQTAVGGAAKLKNNLQLAPDSRAAQQAVALLVETLQVNAAFQAATWVDAVMTPLFARYEPGMTYGNHIDGAIMGEPPMTIRCDIAVTICLNDGASYEGGELVIDAAGAARSWKGKPGDAIVYPADTLHRVEPVTKGIREVAIFWVQSLIRDPGQRRILFDLKSVLDGFDLGGTTGSYVETLRRSYFNLIRMWA